ncbi:hypothetical protein [Aquicoccus sp. SU-CL01552]|uniref:hypothetical protein n=1 Tax=Aquicoccus sp. SU-CL01552 TaxID=3127656 RepID=UPI0031056203
MPRFPRIFAFTFAALAAWMISNAPVSATSSGTVKYDSRAYKEMMNDPVENQPTAYHWQQGVWFAFPVGYRNPYLGEAAMEIITDRERMAEELKLAPERTGFARNGRYDRSLVGDTESVGGFAFKLDSLSPVGRNLRFDADITGDPENPIDEDVVKFQLVWAGGIAPPAPPDVTRRFDRYLSSRGTPPPLHRGHLSWLSPNGLPPAGYQPLPLAHSDIDYGVYEKDGSLTAILRCNVMNETTNRRNVQPVCDGQVRDSESGIMLYLVFPEHIIWSERSWLTPATGALSLLESWRLAE